MYVRTSDFEYIMGACSCVRKSYMCNSGGLYPGHLYIDTCLFEQILFEIFLFVCQVVCVMKHPPSSLYCNSSVFSLLNKYSTGIQFSLESHSTQKHQMDAYLVEEDDTNQSVSSIEDDFVTAFEHLEEEATTAFGAVSK